MHMAEEAGEFEAVAAGIVQNSLGAVENSNLNNDLAPLENLALLHREETETETQAAERVPASQRLGIQLNPNSSPADRVPAQQRLGTQEAAVTGIQGNNVTRSKRKPGRPPGTKTDQANKG